MIEMIDFNGRCSKCDSVDRYLYSEFKMGQHEFCPRCQDFIRRPAGYMDWHRLKSHMVAAWRANFSVFSKAVGLKPSPDHVLTRANSKKPYGPDNLTRWVLRSEYKRKPRTTKPKIRDYTPYFSEKKQKWISGGHVCPSEAAARAFAAEHEEF